MGVGRIILGEVRHARGRVWGGVIVVLMMATVGWGQAGGTSAIELMKERRYNDAIKVLKAEVAGKKQEECGRQFLLMGECYFLTGQFEPARVAFTAAKKYCGEERDRVSAEFRLAGVAFREKDFPGALQKINTFIGDHATDNRVGKLLVYRMVIVGAGGKEVESDMEGMHRAVYERLHACGADVAAEADQVLGDYYRKLGTPAQAERVYVRVAMNLANAIAEKKKEREPVPASLERAHDSAALQLGMLYVQQNQRADAIKWLETVRYDGEMKTRARLFLAKMAYEGGEFAEVGKYVGKGEFLDALPMGAIRSDVYLVLGLAEKANPAGNAAKVETYLREVREDSKGFAQAQATIGDMYREKGLAEAAIKAYRNAAGNAEYGPGALLWIATLDMELAGRDVRQAYAYHKDAAEALKRLAGTYPTSPLIKQAKEKAGALAAKGVSVEMAAGDDENTTLWEKIAREKAGTADGASAVLNLVRHYLKKEVEAKSGKVLREADYRAAGEWADRLLDQKVYSGAGLAGENWRMIRAESLLARGRVELENMGKGGTAEKAVGFLAEGQQLAGAKPGELTRGIDIALLEARFKSEKAENRETAQKRFMELVEQYGAEGQFQKLGIDIAEWARGQGRYEEAAQQYGVVAEHAKDMPGEDVMKLWFAAGSLWTKAGQEAISRQNAAAYVIQVYPKEAVQMGEAFLKSYGALQRTVNVKWPGGGQNMTGKQAVGALSAATGIPFVWSKETGRLGVGTYLEEKRVSLADGATTAGAVLAAVLDRQTHRVGVDIGLCDGTPTLATAGVDGEDANGEKFKTIEIYDVRAAGRYRPLAEPFGELEGAKGSGKRSRSGGVMLYNVLQKVEERSHTRITWAEGIDRQEKLAVEFDRLEGIGGGASCGAVLAAALERAELRYRIIKSDLAPQYFEYAKDAFNKVRKIDPKSSYGEKSLIAVALNFYSLKDYEKMKIVLREYLKVFDSTNNAYYQQACFWVGWAFENERNYREATTYYARAAEERLVVYRPKDGEARLGREQIKAGLSIDSQVALMENGSGSLKDADVEALAEFARTKGHVNVRIEADAQATGGKFTKEGFKNAAIFGVLCDGLEALGLSLKVEHLSPETAEKALYRMAVVYEKDGARDQALEAANLLLARYPQTARKRDVQTLLVSIFKGLKQYAQVLRTLEQLRATAGDDLEKRRLEFEIASMYFDMAAYGRAGEGFRASLSSAKSPEEVAAARDALAKALVRDGKLEEARLQFAMLGKDEANGLRKFTYELMTFTLDELMGKVSERQYPAEAQRFILEYEKLPEERRGSLSAEVFARATWIYYTQALIDLHQKRRGEAMEKLTAVMNSPDDFIAADAGYRIGTMHMEDGDFGKARESLEFLILSTRSSESNVRALYALGMCWEKLNRPERAMERYRQLMERFPLSPMVEMIKQRAVFVEGGKGAASRPATREGAAK